MTNDVLLFLSHVLYCWIESLFLYCILLKISFRSSHTTSLLFIGCICTLASRFETLRRFFMLCVFRLFFWFDTPSKYYRWRHSTCNFLSFFVAIEYG